MLIKDSDPVEAAVDALRALLVRPDVSPRARRDIETEIRTGAAGRKTEKDAAYQINFWFRSRNFMIIHDLRIEHAGRVAQIDHVIINRFLEFYVCESKSFKEGVSINEYGEWTRLHRGRPIGMDSPISQLERHVQVLKSVFEDGTVGLPKRLGMRLQPVFKPVVLVSNSARIERPKTNVDHVNWVIKIDQLHSRLERDVDEKGPGQVVGALARVVSTETLEAIARGLAALHAPKAFDWTARFGLTPTAIEVPASPRPMRSTPSVSTRAALPTSAARICDSCQDPLSAKEIEFCQSNAARFAGRQLCYKCQRRSGRRVKVSPT